MKERICVYTCITGGYDNLREIKNPEKGIDYLCFTNNKNLKSKTWQIIYIDDKKLDDHRLSRKIKMIGHPTIFKNYDISVWTDASIIWDKSVSDFVKTYLKDSPFAAFKHNQRTSIHEEAIACLQGHKDTKENILKTLSFLESEHFPDDLGLYEMTVFIKKHHDETVKKTMELWFDVNTKYSKRDQLSFMYAIWKTNLQISRIDLSVWDNQWFHAIPHMKDSPITKCSIYYGDSSTDFSFEKYYTYTYEQDFEHYFMKCTVPCDTDKIEIEPFDTVGVVCNNIQFSFAHKGILHINNERSYKDSHVYSEFDKFIINGDFKKGSAISFSFDARLASRSELDQIVSDLAKENAVNRQRADSLQHQLNRITNSKSWRFLQKIRKVVRRH